jgi:hypothetical protein
LPSKVTLGWDMVSSMAAVIATNGCLEQQYICHKSFCLQPVTGGLSNNTNQLRDANIVNNIKMVFITVKHNFVLY